MRIVRYIDYTKVFFLESEKQSSEEVGFIYVRNMVPGIKYEGIFFLARFLNNSPHLGFKIKMAHEYAYCFFSRALPIGTEHFV